MWWTGGTVTDLDGDGQLDLLLAHGESASQPISVFKVTQVCVCVWLRLQKGCRRLSEVSGSQYNERQRQTGREECGVIHINWALTYKLKLLC